MTWTRIGDDWTDRPAMLETSRSARLLLVELYVYANRLTTDGRVPTAIIPRLTDAEDWRADLNELAAAGLAEEVDDGRAWLLDWSDQETAEEVRGRQEQRAEKQKRYRRRKRLHEAGDHSECHRDYCRQAGVTRNADGNETGNETSTVTPSRPVPARPVPLQGTGDGGDALTADAERDADQGQDAEGYDPYEPRGDCEHEPGGLDEHTAFPGRVRCKTCRDAAKARDHRQRLTEAAAELSRHRDPGRGEGAVS